MSSLGLESPKKVQREALEEWLKSVVERLGRSDETSSSRFQYVSGHLERRLEVSQTYRSYKLIH